MSISLLSFKILDWEKKVEYGSSLLFPQYPPQMYFHVQLTHQSNSLPLAMLRFSYLASDYLSNFHIVTLVSRQHSIQFVLQVHSFTETWLYFCPLFPQGIPFYALSAVQNFYSFKNMPPLLYCLCSGTLAETQRKITSTLKNVI